MQIDRRILWVGKVRQGLCGMRSHLAHALGNGQKREGDNISPRCLILLENHSQLHWRKTQYERLGFKSEKTFQEAEDATPRNELPEGRYGITLFGQVYKAGEVFTHWTERQHDGTDDCPASCLVLRPGESVSSLERPCLPLVDTTRLTCFSSLGQIQRQSHSQRCSVGAKSWEQTFSGEMLMLPKTARPDLLQCTGALVTLQLKVSL